MPLGETILGAFLGASLNVLFDRLASPEVARFLCQERFETQINKWANTLENIDAVLGDAEEKQLTNSRVEKCLGDLEELAYDVEDMLDEFEYEATARKIKMDEPQSSNWICSMMSLDAFEFPGRMSAKLNDVTRLTTLFDRLCKRRRDLGLQGITGGAPSRSRPPTSAHRTEPDVYGRDEDKKKLLGIVLKNEPTDANLLVIPIVGMAGVGKTTLAREVYRASKDKFQVKAWVCVSDGEFDVTRISKSILENITRSSSLPNDLATVQDKLEEEVVRKKFLLVLDDVWSSDYDNWQILQSPFRESAVGSRIIVTTRDERVARGLNRNQFHRVGLLKPEDCWSVFISVCAFENGSIPAHHIKLIREKVIEKSKRLPLAAKTLGGLLLSKKTDEWLGVLDSKLWDLPEEDGNKIPAVLKLSYHHLPSHLRRCFAYCSIFPKDHEFEIEDVVLLWIAEGLVQQSTENEQLEEVGYNYFSDLLGRSLFQQSSSDHGHKFVMHDLVHDLAQWAFGERSLRLEGVSAAKRQLEGLKKVRHFSYTSVQYDGEKRFEVFQEDQDLMARVKTFFSIPQKYYDQYIARSCTFDLLPKLKRLRVLSLQNYRMKEVSSQIGDLKHLRYLNLSITSIRSLPESTCLLYNLQILLLRYCSSLVKLPSNFKYLIKLRHLDIKGAILLKEMPLGMGKLQNLRKLSNFIVGKGVCSNLEDLGSLSMLHGELCILELHNVISCDHKILKEKDLNKLLLDWGRPWEPQISKSQREVVEENVLNMLQPHENLQELTITNYGGTKFPSWVGAASYSIMKVLRLEDCERCTDLPSLGVLVSLEELTIKGMKQLKHISSKFYGNDQLFKSLKTLCFEDLPMWAHWEPHKNEYVDAFPCLKKLSIIGCSQLSGSLPKHLSALEELVIKDCYELVVSISNIPELCKIEINGCRRIACDNSVDFKSIKYLTLSRILEFSNQLMQECFGKAELQQIKHNKSEKPPVGGLQSIRFLTELVISNCSNIVSFPEVCFLPYLSKLEITFCNNLISLPKEMKMKNACLESLEILCCDSLASIVRGPLPPSLKRLRIDCCEELESLWDDREGSCSSRDGKENGNNTNSSLLEYLDVSNCPSLTCLSSIIHLPATLKHVEFNACERLTMLSQSGLLPASLKCLEFRLCPQLSTITKGFHDSNTSLEDIWIENCDNLQILNGLHNLSHLQCLNLWDCANIECFPEEGLADTNLRELQIRNCEKLKALPFGLRSLDSLEYLVISSCPNITSSNPEEEFPTNLKSLHIEDCVNMYMALVKWGLQNLTSLTSLNICGYLDVESFPQLEMGMMLPPSLTDLRIASFPKLKHLWSHGCQNLTSLRSLAIGDCLDLTSLGDQGLPSSLHKLYIWGCPKLKEECKKNKGREWSKISNILNVEIDGIHIFDLEDDEEAQSIS